MFSEIMWFDDKKKAARKFGKYEPFIQIACVLLYMKKILGVILTQRLRIVDPN